MGRVLGWVGLGAVLLGGAAFAAANAGRLVIIDLGFVTFYRVPVTFVAFGGMVVGMGVMLIAGIHSDLKVRQLLRRRTAPEASRGPEGEEGWAYGGGPQGRGVEAEEEQPSGDSSARTLASPPPDVPDSWERARQSELPIE